MIDMIDISIPFKDCYVFESKTNNDSKTYSSINLSDIASVCDLACSAKVTYDNNGSAVLSELRAKYDSLPSSFTGIAYKVFEGGLNMYPCVRVKASPAKVLQGHNVFGSCDLELGAFELLGYLASEKPELYDLLDFEKTEVVHIDVTFSFRAENNHIAQQIIDFLRSISKSQTKKSRSSDYETTVYWNHNSRSRMLKAYLKYPEMMRQLNALKSKKSATITEYDRNTIRALSNPELHTFATGLVRFEASLYKRYFQSKNIPNNLFLMIEHQKNYFRGSDNFILDLWKSSFKDILDAIGDSTMDIYNDNLILDKLKAEFFSTTPKGNISYSKANRLFGFYRRLVNEGYSNVSNTMDRATFWRHKCDLLSIGLSEAQLQNLTADKSNIVPLLKVMNLDFSAQRPSWYNEPVSRFAVNL